MIAVVGVSSRQPARALELTRDCHAADAPADEQLPPL